MVAKLVATPDPVPVATVTQVVGSGFSNRLTRLKLDGVIAGDSFRATKAGTFTVGVLVASTVKSQTLVAEQKQPGGSWSVVARLAPLLTFGPPGGVDTTPPVLSNISAINITSTSFTVSFSTNEASTTVVNYGLTGAYGSTYTNGSLVTSHNAPLTGLTASTLYHYRVQSTDSKGNNVISGDQTVTTFAGGVTDTTPPVISNIATSQNTGTSIVISWSLDEFATGQIQWGLTTAYGNFTARENSFAYNAHVQQITGLTPGQVYHFRILSDDASGNHGISADQVFTAQGSQQTAGPIYGTGWNMDSLNNKHVGLSDAREVSQRFRAVSTTTLTNVKWYLRLGGGYSLGNGGIASISIQTDDGSSNHLPSGTIIGTPQTYVPGNTGTGTTVSTNLPNIPVTGGQIYHVVWKNTSSDQTANNFSVNISFMFNAIVPRQPCYTDAESGVSSKSSGVWSPEANESVNMDVTSAAGWHAGSNYSDCMLNNYGLIAGPSKMVREHFTVSGGNRVVTQAWVRIGRQSGTGLLTIGLYTEAGTLIESGTVAASGVNAYTVTADADNGDWVGITFGTPRTLTNGSTYYLRFSTDNASQYSAVPLRQPTVDGTLSRSFTDGVGEFSTDAGATWTDLYLYAPQNTQMYFVTQ